MTDDRHQTARIAHVLFLDIVGYSKERTPAQAALMNRLNEAVLASAAFSQARAADTVLVIPTGDGMALLFYSDVAAPARCAVEVGRTIREGGPKVRMGIHSGLVQPQVSLSGQQTVVGEGINTAQRIMDCGDAGHILLSGQYAGWLQQFEAWAPAIHPVGEVTAKHGQKLQIFNLYGSDFGKSARLGKLKSAIPQEGGTGRRVALLYRPHGDIDESVLNTLETQLLNNGCQVFVDHHQKINAAWAREIEEPIRSADAVIAIVSPRAMQSEMLQFEIETAHDQQLATGKPAILPVIIGVPEDVQGPIADLIRPLRRFTWKSAGDDQRLIAELLSAINEPLKLAAAEVKLEPVGGAVSPDSPFYVVRDVDREFLQALGAGESILLVKGARQTGKTSLLAQGVKRAREMQSRVGLTDFQKLNTALMASDDSFYRLLAAALSRPLGFRYDFAAEWDPIFGASLNMENFLRELVNSGEGHFTWFMDEVDKLFTAPFASDFFGLVRSWHNSRSTEPDGPWSRLTVVIAYATEAHLFIQDLNQSPFNVGRKLDLKDFNLQQLVDLNGRYGGPLPTYADCEALYGLIGGQPYLTRMALDALATGKQDLRSLLENAATDEGPFADHLKRVLVAVSRLPEVTEFIESILSGEATTHHQAYHRLLAAGVIQSDRRGHVRFRCELYRLYLANRL